ncbi:hypothetical protein ACGCE5_08725 [Kluyvera ascorbata]|uniref:hypothetical protein n=1 Tax=Kluyvera ascorbata TaxID=51288 RepID=UPI00374DDF5A
MENLIIYRIGSEAEQTFVLLVPANCGLTVEEIAVKDTPEGAPFWIISTDEYTASDDFQAVLRGLVKDQEPDGFGGSQGYQ